MARLREIPGRRGALHVGRQLVFVALLANAPLLAAQPPDDMPVPPGLQALMKFACPALLAEFEKRVAAGRYLKPDGGNAGMVVSAMMLKGCKFDENGATFKTLVAGAQITSDYLSENNRATEFCSLWEFSEYVPNAQTNMTQMAQLRKAFCSPPPPSTWTDDETALMFGRVQRLPELAVLHDQYNSAVIAQRWLGPAGDNALEYALRGREKSFGKERQVYLQAIATMAPQAAWYAQQALNAKNWPEFDRLMELMARVDPDWPEVARLRTEAAPQRPK